MKPESGPQWVTIGTFPHGMDSIFIEYELAEHGIAYNKLDETTIQVVPHLSQALGGVRIQVMPNDVDQALEILRVAGVEMEIGQPGSSLLLSFDRSTRSLPVIGTVSLGWRFLLVIGVFFALLGFLAYWLFAPDLSDQLAARDWCVVAMDQNGSPVEIGTTGQWRVITNDCPERIVFSSNGTVRFPGIGTHEINASWELVKNLVRVYNADTLSNIYEGEYDVHVDDFRMVMRSPTTSIKTERDRTFENLFRGL